MMQAIKEQTMEAICPRCLIDSFSELHARTSLLKDCFVQSRQNNASRGQTSLRAFILEKDPVSSV